MIDYTNPILIAMTAKAKSMSVIYRINSRVTDSVLIHQANVAVICIIINAREGFDIYNTYVTWTARQTTKCMFHHRNICLLLEKYMCSCPTCQF